MYGKETMKYKILALDMDGTVLDSNNQISERTLAAIRQAQKLGVIVIVATGRPWQSFQKYQRTLQISHPIITYNGGMVISADGREVLHHQKLSATSVLEIIKLGKMYNISQCMWANGRLYIIGETETLQHYAAEAGVAFEKAKDIECLAKSGVTKVLWYDIGERIAKCQNELVEKLQAKDVSYFTSLQQYLEFVDIGVSKGIALSTIATQFGVEAHEVMAIGDGMNDISMLNYAGLGIVMKNASDAVKEYADYVTKTNDEHGVAIAIEHFIASSE